MPLCFLADCAATSMRSESAAAEQAIFDDLKERAAAWEEQAGRTLLLDKTLEYVRTPHVQHTANEWQTTEHNRHIRSNRVYQMNYHIYENTRYDRRSSKASLTPILSHGRLYQQPNRTASEDCRTR